MRHWMVIIGAVALALQSAPCFAQNPTDDTRHEYTVDANSPETSPELYFYLDQQRRHDDPKMLVKANAERRAQQRRQRIASRRWYGLSNARPVANPTPWFGTYSPMWSGSFWNPFVWSSYQFPTYVILSQGS